MTRGEDRGKPEGWSPDQEFFHLPLSLLSSRNLDGESLSTSEALRFRRARARDETVRYYGYSDLLLQKKWLLWSGSAPRGTGRARPLPFSGCGRAAPAGHAARALLERPRPTVAGDQALGGGCRLAGGEQLHVPFRGMLATQMCTSDVHVYSFRSKINIILEFKICPIKNINFNSPTTKDKVIFEKFS